jgi:hypothetical protein
MSSYNAKKRVVQGDDNIYLIHQQRYTELQQQYSQQLRDQQAALYQADGAFDPFGNFVTLNAAATAAFNLLFRQNVPV